MPQALPAIGAIAGLAGSVINALPKGEASSQTIGRPENVQNVNPYTGGFWNQMQNMLGQYSPTANIGSLQGLTGGVNQITSDVISPFGTSLMGTANLLSNEARRQVANDFSQNNSLNSGAALSALARGAATPISQAISQIAGMQSQLGGSLLGTAQNQMGAFGQGALGWLGQTALPEWWQPTYVTGAGTSGAEPFGGALSFLSGALPGLSGIYGGGQSTLPQPQLGGK
jgi:hypothetical protein